jgi:hypothetical protein
MPRAVDLENTAADVVRERGRRTWNRRVRGRRAGGRRRGRRRRRGLAAFARAAREADGHAALRAGEELTAVGVVGAARAQAESGCVAAWQPCGSSAGAASGAICLGLAFAEATDLPRADAPDAGRIEVAQRDAVGVPRAVDDAGLIADARPRHAAERRARRLAVEARGTVRRERIALRDDALVTLATVGPGAIGAAENLTRQVDAEGPVGTVVMAPAGRKVLRRKALGRSGQRALLAGLQGFA